MTVKVKRWLIVSVAVALIGAVASERGRVGEFLTGVLWRVGAGAALTASWLGQNYGAIAAVVSILGLVMNFLPSSEHASQTLPPRRARSYGLVPRRASARCPRGRHARGNSGRR